MSRHRWTRLCANPSSPLPLVALGKGSGVLCFWSPATGRLALFIIVSSTKKLILCAPAMVDFPASAGEQYQVRYIVTPKEAIPDADENL